ncbi:MAG: non-homologous end-joining DNA ligase [Microthrixaceae bacterium]
MSDSTVNVGSRQLKLSNLDKVLYPQTGFTKAEVIDYYARIGEVMVRHTKDRCVTLRRWPDGVDGQNFFEKNCPKHRPEWVDTAQGPGRSRGEVHYCLLDEPAALVWTANLAALELHTPMALAEDQPNPRACVFDLDPGPKTNIVQCAQLALEIREVLESVDLQCFAKTSGSKGMQVYVPLNASGTRPHTHAQCADFARAVGALLEQRHPKGVTTVMAKDQRPGRVFVDWSQNAFHKTTICVYSLRARAEPTASTPLDWDEVAAGAEGEHPLVYLAGDVIERIDSRGDLFDGVLDLQQRLPAPKAS